MLSIIFLNVKAMPPQMIISSTLSNMFSINWILSATCKKGHKRTNYFNVFKYLKFCTALDNDIQ